MISRTQSVLNEFGPYGPSLRGTTGFSKPLGMNRNSTYPYQVDPKKEKERLYAVQRRRDRLGELAAEFAIFKGAHNMPLPTSKAPRNSRGQT